MTAHPPTPKDTAMDTPTATGWTYKLLHPLLCPSCEALTGDAETLARVTGSVAATASTEAAGGVVMHSATATRVPTNPSDGIA